MSIYDFFAKIKRTFHRFFCQPFIKVSFKKHGKRVRVFPRCSFYGISNISLGDDVSIGEGSRFICTRANIIIGSHVMIGPSVTIVTGNHKIDIPDKFMSDVTDEMKDKNDDENVVIEDDVWIGTNAIILKGVKIGKGSVIAAGSIVTSSVDECSIYGGNPARKIKDRFNDTDRAVYLSFVESNKRK